MKLPSICLCAAVPFCAAALFADEPLRARVITPEAGSALRGAIMEVEAHTTLACMGVGWTFTEPDGTSTTGFSPQRNAGQRFRYRRIVDEPGRHVFRFAMQDADGKPWLDAECRPIPPQTLAVKVRDAPAPPPPGRPRAQPAFSADRDLPDAPVEVRGGGAARPLLMTGRVEGGRMFFRPGERIAMRFRPAVPCVRIRICRVGDDGFWDEPLLDVPGDGVEAVYATDMARPGAVFVTATPVDADGAAVQGPGGRPISLTLGAIVGPDDLRGHAEGRPADFDAFWAERKRRLAAALGPADLKPPEPGNSGRFHVSIPCGEAMPSTGGYARPVDAPPKSCEAEIRFSGYNPVADAQAPVLKAGTRKIVFDFSTHGTPCGMPGDFYQRFAETNRLWQYGFELDRNRNPDTTYFRDMTMRMLAAIAFVKAQPEWDGRTLRLVGGSQGGFFALMGAALEPDVTDVVADQPWLCDLDSEPLDRMGGFHPRWTPALAYYLPYHHAPNIRARVQLSAGLADTTCTPSGILAVYHAIRSPKQIDLHQAQGHCGGIAVPEISCRFSDPGKGR